ncbi:hypothetical protein DFH09DRAFT_308395 [Mycena vulgaris]|nr:hypothetical protein DFH09DRAFT_308395 [Mycena vulgaris]
MRMFLSSDDRWGDYLVQYNRHRNLPAARQFPRLNNLVNFDCVGFRFTPIVLRNFNPKLRSLRLGWNANCLFPFDAFPCLEHLFIYVILPDIPKEKSNSGWPRIHPSLATLSIIDNMGWFDKYICAVATFPNLRAFHLLTNRVDPRMWGFIAAHRNLLEVNLPRAFVSFPDLFQLAKGGRKTIPSLLDPSSALGPADHTDFLMWNDLQLASFAFVRAAQKPSENPTDPVASHILTEFSLQTSPSDVSTLFIQEIGGLSKFPLLADCTRLSLVISRVDEIDPDMESMESMMTALGENLTKFKKLRYFYLACTFPDYDPPPMRGDEPLDCETYLEECVHEYGVEWVEDLRREAITWGWDCQDDACAMKLWEAQHEMKMTSLVRCLAEACATLETFEFSLRSPGFDSTELSMGLCSHPPLWRWSIWRNPDRSVRLVSGYLTWNGHPQHPSSYLGEQFKKYKN